VAKDSTAWNTPEIDCDQMPMGLPLVTPAVFLIKNILVKHESFGGISEVPLLLEIKREWYVWLNVFHIDVDLPRTGWYVGMKVFNIDLPRTGIIIGEFNEESLIRLRFYSINSRAPVLRLDDD
jgi:hypothetical protein